MNKNTILLLFIFFLSSCYTVVREQRPPRQRRMWQRHPRERVIIQTSTISLDLMTKVATV